MPKTVERVDAVRAVLVILLAIVYWLFVPYEVPDEQHPFGITGRFFPQLIALLILGCGSLLLVRTLVPKRRGAESREKLGGLEWRALRRVLPHAGILLLYVISLDILGYISASVPAIVLLMLHAAARDWRIIMPVAVLTPICLYLFFQKVMYVQLPEGLLL